jgi:hypothetical protein
MATLAVSAAILAAGISASPAAAIPGEVRTIDQFGTCLLDAHNRTALEMLNASTAAGSEDALKRLRGEKSCFNRLANNSPLDMRIATLPKDFMRGIIAGAAVRSSPAAKALQPLAFEQKRYVRPWFATTGRDSAVDEMSVCVADTDPAGVLALVETPTNSADESIALGGLMPWLGKCLVAGARLQADRTALRAALAEALYQRVRNPALSLPAPATETPK